MSTTFTTPTVYLIALCMFIHMIMYRFALCRALLTTMKVCIAIEKSTSKMEIVKLGT